MHTKIRTIALVAFLQGGFPIQGFASTADQSESLFKPITIVEPFRACEAQRKLSELLPSAKSGALEVLRHARELRFEFYAVNCPYPEKSDCSSPKYVDMRRTLVLNGEYISQLIANKIDSLRHSGCSTAYPTGHRASVVEAREIGFMGSYFFKRNWCIGSLSGKIVEGNGNWWATARLFFDPETIVYVRNPSDGDKGNFDIKITDSGSRIDNARLLEVFNIKTVGGDIVKFFVKLLDDVLSVLKTGKLAGSVDDSGDNVIDSLVTESEQLLKDYFVPSEEAFRRSMKKLLGRRTFFVNTDNTKFVSQGSTFDLRVAHDAFEPAADAKILYDHIQDLKIIMDDWKRSTATVYEIRPADSLWSIAEDYYGDGARYVLILAANPDIQGNGDLIVPGKTIELHPLWHYSRAAGRDQIVPLGGSLWGQFNKSQPPEEWNLSRLRPLRPSPDVHTVYPGQPVPWFLDRFEECKE